MDEDNRDLRLVGFVKADHVFIDLNTVKAILSELSESGGSTMPDRVGVGLSRECLHDWIKPDLDKGSLITKCKKCQVYWDCKCQTFRDI